jgi:hypothetical protein
MIATIFIGYDAREDTAAQVAAFSLRRRATCHVKIYALEHRLLRRLGLFRRMWSIDPTGQFWDAMDGKPFSTEFSHSRFLVFDLAKRLKTQGPCMFVDCDWLFLHDVEPLMDQTAANAGKIGVVMRDREVDDGSTKMDGMVQRDYPRKLWSALFTFMPTPDLAKAFTVETVNMVSGRSLHGFLDRKDEDFWQIDPAWHYIPSLDLPPDEIKGCHFSEFSPWLNPDKQSQAPGMFWAWEDEVAAWRRAVAQHKNLRVFDDLEADLAVSTLDV